MTKKNLPVLCIILHEPRSMAIVLRKPVHIATNFDPHWLYEQYSTTSRLCVQTKKPEAKKGMDKKIAKRVALGAILAATVTLSTMLHVPLPGLRIYFNLGEGVIYIIALLLGARFGGLCGGVGAGLADILLGYPLWAPLTLVIKGLEGYIVGRLAPRGRIMAIAAGAAVMIAGYTTSAGILYGWKVAPVELMTDIAQTGIGAAFALIMLPILEKRIGLKA
jgi:uncharacterized membrane protein